tara:strand:+ start:124 stop:489 length:366 start_codon:yes stop_codon:yes gene_type:complete
MDLTASDYKKIASYYHIPKSKNKTYKEIAEQVLSSKLCRCIKSVDSYNDTSQKKNEDVAISVCRKSIFQNRNIDFYDFKCKTKSCLIKKPKSSSALTKTSKKVRFEKKRTRRPKTLKKKKN